MCLVDVSAVIPVRTATANRRQGGCDRKSASPATSEFAMITHAIYVHPSPVTVSASFGNCDQSEKRRRRAPDGER